MSISFNGIPNTLRVPFLYAEFDSSKAQQGAGVQAYKLLVLGQKRSTGTAVADVPVRVTNIADAITFFGEGSFLHNMLVKVFKNNKVTSCTVIPQADNGAGVAASGALSFTGPATSDGTLSLYIGGVLIQIAVASGDIATAIATNVAAAINEVTSLPVTAAVDGTDAFKVNITCQHKGLLGNGIDLRFNYQDGEALPAGVACTITAMASGTTAPTLTAAISAMGEVQFNVIACPYNDATSLSAIEAELLDRWGPMRQNDGVAFTAKDDTNGNLITFGDGRNSKHVCCVGIYKALSPSYEIAAAVAAVAAFYGNIDPARPFTGLPLLGIVAPAETNQFTLEERNLLLLDGIATLKVDANGLVVIERLITMYQKNSSGAADTSFLDVNTLLTLSYLRWDWRTYMMNKYPRHKLASDGTRFGAGQAIITPKVGKAEAVAKFREWEELGLVEGGDQFKRDLIVERNASDPNRLDFLLPTDLINQLQVIGTQIGFLL
jgi:phage tail sheath gpL-like